MMSRIEAWTSGVDALVTRRRGRLHASHAQPRHRRISSELISEYRQAGLAKVNAMVSTSAPSPSVGGIDVDLERSGPAAEREKTRRLPCPASGSLAEGRSRSGAARSRRAVRPI